MVTPRKPNVRPGVKKLRPGLRGTLRWWRNTLLETAILFTLVVLGEVLLGDGRIGSFRVHPHPYWLVVLPMAASRGLVAALIAASVAAVLYGFGAHEAQGGGALSQLIDLDLMLEPLLFFSAGFVVGEFRDVISDRYRALAQRLADTHSQALTFRKQRDVLAEANHILERRLVDHSAQFGNLIETATRIELAGRREVFEVALELVDEHCGAAASVLVPVADGEVDFLCHRGWPRAEESDRLADAQGSPFVHRAIATGAEVSGFVAGETPPSRGPLAAVPLLDHLGVVQALLCLDEIPTSRLNPSSLRTFRAIADWISSALARLSCMEARADAADAVELSFATSQQVVGPEDLCLRLRIEFERCTRHGVPVSVIALQFTEWTDVGQKSLDRLDRFLRDHVVTVLRTSDSVHRFGFPGCYVLVLAATPTDGAAVARDRILQSVPLAFRELVGAMRTEVRGPDTQAPNPHELLRSLAAGFNRESALPLGIDPPFRLTDVAPAGTPLALAMRLRAEVSLSMRIGNELHVIELCADPDAHSPGLLALHVEQVSHDLLRGTDSPYAIGPSHVAVVLPHTSDVSASDVAQRLRRALVDRNPGQPYGEVSTRVLGLGPEILDAEGFLDALGERGSLHPIVAGGQR